MRCSTPESAEQKGASFGGDRGGRRVDEGALSKDRPPLSSPPVRRRRIIHSLIRAAGEIVQSGICHFRESGRICPSFGALLRGACHRLRCWATIPKVERVLRRPLSYAARLLSPTGGSKCWGSTRLAPHRGARNRKKPPKWLCHFHQNYELIASGRPARVGLGGAGSLSGPWRLGAATGCLG